MKKITIPISDEAIRELKVGDSVLLSGVMLTGRDSVHKWMNDTFITNKRQPEGDDLEVYETIKPILDGGIIYHCGPVVRPDDDGYHFVAAGPTTSIREEPYQADVMDHFGVRGVIGKGGMGSRTLDACHEHGAVYLHAVGG
ncbi:MAG: fumarate hydratase C-terminal domain-containing protein, partial [Anaerolineae bacterium]|nr:fumarate hydratase C-terminal domain-containing protein [Anaerolineae bacterium]